VQNYVQAVVIVPERRGRVITRIMGMKMHRPGVAEIEILLDGSHMAKHNIQVNEPAPANPNAPRLENSAPST
jgi:hypothetical protein